MDPKPDRLTTAFIKSIDRPTRRGDGRGSNGLSIIAYTNAAGGLNKAWSQRIIVDGKERTFGLGRWPYITLTVARKRAFENVRNRDLGENIREKKNTPNLGEAFDQHIANHTPQWQRRGKRRAEQLIYEWNHSKEYFASILSKKVSAITHDEVIDILRDDWHQRGPTASRMQSHLSQILEHAVETEIRASNPANRKFIVRTLGPLPEGGNFQSAPYEELAAYLAKIRDSEKLWWAAKYCLMFIAFTEDRSGEARESVWSDVDWKKETLTIPRHRMKGPRDHVIPLSPPAMEILRLAWSKPRHSQGSIFPPKRGGVFMRSKELSRIKTKLDIPFVPHGLRASFGSWAAEHENLEYKELAKLSLAHVVDSKSDKPYFPTTVLEKRRAMLREYAQFLTQEWEYVILPKDR